MNKLFLLLILSASMSLNAQIKLKPDLQSSEKNNSSDLSSLKDKHIKFKNIPIDGHINLFTRSMERIGYVKTKTLKNCTIFTGDFAGKKCEIYVLYTDKTNTVWKVGVFLPESSNWYKLKSDYQDFKEQYTMKYGLPSDTFEFFSKPYYEGDGYEIQAINLEKCTYESYWNVENGSIVVKIGTSSNVVLGYEDLLNGILKENEKTSSIQNDI